MKNFMIWVIACLVSLSFLAGGIYLAVLGIQGWGWLIFGGIISVPSASFIASKEEDKNA